LILIYKKDKTRERREREEDEIFLLSLSLVFSFVLLNSASSFLDDAFFGVVV